MFVDLGGLCSVLVWVVRVLRACGVWNGFECFGFGVLILQLWFYFCVWWVIASSCEFTGFAVLLFGCGLCWLVFVMLGLGCFMLLGLVGACGCVRA